MPRESEQLVQHDKKMMDVFIITLEAFVGKHILSSFSHGGLKYNSKFMRKTQRKIISVSYLYMLIKISLHLHKL